MARERKAYVCTACGHAIGRWVGKCPECGEWGTLGEVPTSSGGLTLVGAPQPVVLGEIGDETLRRIPTGIGELDRVLGGGLVEGSLVLIGGEPGIGKSTLVLQALAHLSTTGSALLITGEESAAQVAGRGRRLAASCAAVQVLAETRLEAVISTIEAHRPTVCAIDSVQTLVSDRVEGAYGSVTQVRQATAELVRIAKSLGTVIILVGQVTKDGNLAGPRTLEHLVDCVLTFDGDHLREHRVLRSSKNRFGSTDETALFSMGADGLTAIEDPSAIYLAESGDRIGSCVFPAVEGSRTVLVEIQALVGPTEVIPPRRLAGGVDRTRLAQVIAVLNRHAGRRFGDQDVFVSVAAGARALDPAADLAIALALVSADRGKPLVGRPAAFGELGLTGAIRRVGHHDRRAQTAAGHGITMTIAPETRDQTAIAGLQAVADIQAAIELVSG